MFLVDEVVMEERENIDELCKKLRDVDLSHVQRSESIETTLSPLSCDRLSHLVRKNVDGCWLFASICFKRYKGLGNLETNSWHWGTYCSST